MARGVNKVILIGALGRDPESRYMPNGNAICNISLATDESYNDKNTGQRVDRTEWHRVVAFGRLAEIMAQYLKKGSKAYIEGRLQTREWEKDGIKRYTTEIIANEMTMLDSRNANSGGMEEHSYGMGTMAQPNSQPFGGMPQQPNMAPHSMQPSTAQAQQTAASHPGGYGQAPQQAPQNTLFTDGQQQPQQQNMHNQQPTQEMQQQPKPQPAPAGVPNFDDFDDDIPF